MRKVILAFLRFFAKKILEKQQPSIIGITGSIGKTSAKEAAYFALKKYIPSRRNKKSYNNEFGLPLTVIGKESGGKSAIRWAGIFSKAIRLSFLKDKKYPKILILEMGADKVGDLKYLASLFPKGLFKVLILTAIAPVHLEAFHNLDNVFLEKTSLLDYLSKDGIAIINKDNCPVKKIKENFPKNKFFFYGIKKDRLSDIWVENTEARENGLLFRINKNGSNIEYFLDKGISEIQIYPILSAILAADYFSIPLPKSVSGLKDYKLPKGRLNLLPGANGSLIIDDTYNSSPKALSAAIKSLSGFPFGKRKIAVLGDMLELGEKEEDYHFLAGKEVAENNIDILVTYGKLGKIIGEGALKNSIPKENIFIFQDMNNLTKKLLSIISKDDIVLIKGSQGMRMERITEAVMANRGEAKKLLVRQDWQWRKN